MAEDFICFQGLKVDVGCGRRNGHLMLDLMQFDRPRLEQDPKLRRFLLKKPEVTLQAYIAEKPAENRDTWISDAIRARRTGVLKANLRKQVNNTYSKARLAREVLRDHNQTFAWEIFFGRAAVQHRGHPRRAHHRATR